MVSTEQLLDFEAAHPTWTGSKEEAIIRELGLRPARYWQLLHRVVLTREAVEHDPMTSHRIVRQIEERSSFNCRLY
ncbi:DUF3263 domain-containing protein [Microbacterium sp. H37-C3]|uniref:DUF3263 domain-containing protein n=1 Tax=Microbacterium sp. H37-C3 TaxID=3004354 RepID=UPI0022AF8E79|nr:DUF3263 domain-containing protein [Microbacterium sp. H37-C3]